MSKRIRQRRRGSSEAKTQLGPSTRPFAISTTVQWLILGAILLTIGFIRVRLLPIPLERDEGGFAYMGRLILDGIPPYTQAYDFKPPGLYATYALSIAMFGETSTGVHMGLLIANIIGTFFMFLLVKRLFDPLSALCASAAFGFLAMGPSLLGFAAHATQYVTLYTIIGMYCLLVALDTRKLINFFLSGLFFGLAFQMKQPGLLILPTTLAGIIVFERFQEHFSIRDILKHSLAVGFGFLTPLLAVVAILYAYGALQEWWFWCFVYSSSFGSTISPSLAAEMFWVSSKHVVDGFGLVWLVAGVGLVLTIIQRPVKKSNLIVLAFAFFSFLSITPGFHFREHYFVMLIPAVAILAAIPVGYIATSAKVLGSRNTILFLTLTFFLVALAVGINANAGYFFRDDPFLLSRKIYGGNPFPEDVIIADALQKRTDASDRIAVLGSEPQIYFYSHRKAATGHIFVYWLVEKHQHDRQMQEQMIKEIEEVSPKYLLFVNVPTSWALRNDSERLIFDWTDKYTREHYQVDGIVDILPTGTRYYWDDSARAYSPQSTAFVVIYKRITT